MGGGHIKQITIQGFKSYKDQMQIEPFSPKCNVIVGRNGSGKSNFFAAARFVLNDDYNFLNRQERQALLHEGSGSAVMSAYVEVSFDNTGDRFQIGKPEFILRRTIGAKKDEYSVNRKSVTKTEVRQILEAAGFSQSNPFYIVPQGRVTYLTNMKDTERLNLLKSISGSGTYEGNRETSMKTLQQTDLKCANIDSVTEAINERLDELEGEKEELEAWSKNDKERRSLVYTIKSREEARLEAEIENIDSLENHGREMRENNEAVFMQNEEDMAKIDTQINKRQGDLNVLRGDRAQYENDRKAATLEKAKVELELKSLQDNQSGAQQTKSRRDQQVKSIQQQIAAREAELQQLLPQYNQKKEEEEAVRAQLLDAEGQRKRLEEKQGRSAFYSTKKQRDDALRAQINESNGDLSRRKAVLMQTNDEIGQLKEDIERIEGEVAELRTAIENEGDAAVNLAAQVEKARDTKKALLDEQTNLWREQNRMENQLGNAQKELQSAEHTFSRLLDHGTSRGLESLRRYRKEGIQGVHGTIAELLQVPENYRSVTESAAEAALFHVVVDDDDVASKLIDRLIKDRGGRLTFIPLNRVDGHDSQLRATENMQPLLPKLSYDARFEAAFKHVFGKIVVCPTLDECKRVAKQYNVRAYNPDGDNATRKGQYRGGFHDPSRSKINAHRIVAECRAQVDELQQRKREIIEELETKRQQLTAATSEVMRRQHERDRGENSYGPMREEIRAKQGGLQDIRDNLVRKQRTAADLESAINQLGAQQSDWEAEIASKFQKTLTNDEEQMLNTLASTVNDYKKQYAQLKQERAALETQKIEAELELSQNLQPNLDDLLVQQESASGSTGQSSRLKESKRALEAVNRSIADLDRQIQETDTQIEEISGQLEALEQSRSEKEQSNRALAQAMEKQEKSMSRKDADRSTLTAQLAEVKRAIRDLGTLPEDVDRKYSRWDINKLSKELTRVNHAQKQFAHVNKKAYEQYENFTRQRKTLTDRRAELDTSRKSIENLIQVLDQRKDEAIARTFRQVASAFKKVFEELVPTGTGRLIINRRSDQDVRRGDDDEDSEDESARRGKKDSNVEEYVSVSISVSFNSKHDEQQKISQLSGGQKSLCALALIFAIQQCDPAPFYLFDEIDANLDAQYRTAVANMLQKLSGQGGPDQTGGGQFICTTFRPEMVLVADKCYGVSYSNKTSSIDVVEREAALEFVDGMQK